MAATSDLNVKPGDPRLGGDSVHLEKGAIDVQHELGHLANQEDHENGVFASLKKYPLACAWCIFACWCVTLSGFDNQAGAAVIGIPQFRKDFGEPFGNDYVIPAAWQSAINAAPVASGIFGGLGGAWISDQIGRKKTLMLALVISYAAISMEFVATTKALFFGGKFLNGFAIGAIPPVMTTYIGEVSPLAWRGIWTCCIGVAYGVGPLVAFIVINYTGDVETRWSYRVIMCSQYFFAAVATILVPFMPESPWWLVRIHKVTAARKALHKFGFSEEGIKKRIDMIELTLEKFKHETAGTTYLECFRKSNLRRTMISTAPLIIQSITGITFVAGYFTYYLQVAGYGTAESFRIQIAQPTLSIVGNLMAAAMIDRVGRRDLTFWGLAILVVFLFITGGLAVGGSPGEIKGTVAFILLYSWMYNVSIGSTAFTILTEMPTARLRAKTVAIGGASQGAINTMWQFVLPLMFNPDKGNLGGKVAFIFGAPSFLCLVYLWFEQPETAGRTYEEMDEMFAKRIPARKFKGYKTDAEQLGEAARAAQH